MSTHPSVKKEGTPQARMLTDTTKGEEIYLRNSEYSTRRVRGGGSYPTAGRARPPLHLPP
eukprot:11179170-Heterocapsa_arctica.AAC.1